MSQEQEQEQRQPSFINSLMFHKLDPYTKLRNGVVFQVGIGYGLIVGFICLSILDVMFAMSGPTRTPLLDFNIHSFNLSSSSPSSSSTVVDFSVRNPLPFPLHVYLARASISRNHSLLATGFMQPFHVPAVTPDRRLVMVSSDLSLSLSSSSISDAAGLGMGFEFEVDGLVKVHEGSRRQRMRSIKVVCNDFEVLISSDFSAATLVGGPNKCVQSWGDIY